jgi:hypothetical protein
MWSHLRVLARPAFRACAVVSVGLATEVLGATAVGTIPADCPVGITVPVEVPLSARIAGTETARADGRPLIASVRIGGAAPTAVPAQLEPADPRFTAVDTIRFLLTVQDSDRGKPVEIRTSPGEEPKPAYAAAYKDPMLAVTTVDGKPVLSYWHGTPDFKNAKKYPLNDFIDPVIGLDGETLTVASPPDHVHHRGVFWAWVRNERVGKWQADWWMPNGIHAEAGELDRGFDGPVYSRFAARHFWTYQPDKPTGGERFIEESFVCRVYQTTREGRAVDLDLSLTALEDGIRIGGQTALDKGYGGMSCRFANATNVRIESDRGLIQEDSLNHVKAVWVDWTGMFVGTDGKRREDRSGGALLVHPSHPDCPPEWIVRAYGPINVAWPGLRMLDLPKGKPVHLRYRLWIHRGDAKAGRVSEQFRAYAADWGWNTR